MCKCVIHVRRRRNFFIKCLKNATEECQTKTEVPRPKTKTAHLLSTLQEPSYTRSPIREIRYLSKHETKTLMIARYGMLECGKNFQGTLNSVCDTCNCLDDEEHRLNVCINYSSLNYVLDPIRFDTIFSDDISKIKAIIERIAHVWNVKTGHGTMNSP